MSIRFSVLFAVLFTLLSCEGAEDRQAFYLDKAKSSIDERNYEKAKLDLKNVIQIDPRNSEAIYLLGTILEKQGKYEGAYKRYVRAIEYDEGNIDARFRLGRIYLQASDHDSLEKEIEKIESISPGHIYAKSLNAAVQYVNRSYEEVIKIIDTIEDADRSENIFELYAISIYGLGDINKSIAILETAVKHYPSSIKLNGELAALYEESGDITKAETMYKKILSIDDTKNIYHYVNLSKFYGRNNENEKADDVFNKLIQTDPKNEDYQLLRVSYIKEKYGDEKAIEYMVSLIRDYPNQDKYKLSLAKLYYKNKDSAKAKSIIEDVIEKNYNDKSVTNARNLLAVIAIANGDIDSAEKELSKVQDISPNDVEANFLLGKISLSKKKYAEAVKALRIVVRESPDNGDAYVYLANALKYQGSIDLARDVLAQGVQYAPKNMKLVASFIGLLMEKGEFEYSLNLLKALPANDVSDDVSEFNLLKLKARVYFANKKYEESLKIAKIVMAKYPKVDEGFVLAAGSYSKLGQLNEASQILRAGLDATASPRLLVGYANVEKSLGRIDELIGFLEAYKEYKPVVSNMLADLYRKTNKLEKSEYYYNQAIATNPKWDTPYLGLADLYKSKDDAKKAVEILSNAEKTVDDTQKILFGLAGLYLEIGNIEKSVAIYDQILNDDPANVNASNNLALILVDEFDDKAKIERAYNLVKNLEQHSNPLIVDTVGWVYAKSGRHADAVFVLSKLVAKWPNIQIFKYHLGMAYYYKGDIDNAYKAIEEFSGKKINKESWSQDIKKIVDEFEKAQVPASS